MKAEESNRITSNQMTIIISSTMVGVGILSLAGAVVKDAKQDGWMAIILGGLYPLYIVFLGICMSKKFPKNNILFLNKKYFGKIIGTVLNVLFLFYFLFYVIAIASGLSNILKIYVVSYLTPIKILSIVLLAVVYGVSQNIMTISRANQVLFYVTVALFIIPVVALKKTNYLNFCPVFSAGLLNIIKASKEGAFAYGGSEIIFLIYPFIEDTKKLKSAALKGVGLTATIYTWFVLINIGYLGIDIIPMHMWSFLPVTDSLVIPVINNFRFIFMFLWSLVIYKTIMNNYYAVTFIVSDLLKKIKNLSFKAISYFLYPLVLWGALAIGGEVNRRNLLDLIIPKYTLFVVIWPSILVLLIYLKKDHRIYEKN